MLKLSEVYSKITIIIIIIIYNNNNNNNGFLKLEKNSITSLVHVYLKTIDLKDRFKLTSITEGKVLEILQTPDPSKAAGRDKFSIKSSKRFWQNSQTIPKPLHLSNL